MKKQKKTTPPQEAKRSPVFTEKVGAVHASVFLNTTKSGTEFPSAVINRRYQDKDGNWKSSDSYGLKHLTQLTELVATVSAWVKKNYPGMA